MIVNVFKTTGGSSQTIAVSDVNLDPSMVGIELISKYCNLLFGGSTWVFKFFINNRAFVFLTLS
jgi:hypothetical protein